jgi:hypothetical protein
MKILTFNISMPNLALKFAVQKNCQHCKVELLKKKKITHFGGLSGLLQNTNRSMPRLKTAI